MDIMSAEPAPTVDYARLENTAFPKRRMDALTAVVVGAGALGNEVVRTLSLIGAGRIIVVDPDTVEPSNLTRSVFFSYYNSAGRNKAVVLSEVCGRLFPNTRFEGLPVEIADVGFQDLKQADLVFSCVDSDLARLEIAYAATKLDLPVADAGLAADNHSQGRVSWFGGRRAACFSCMLSRQARREILAFNAVAARSCWTASAGAGDEGVPSTPMMAAVVAGAQVDLGLRALLDGRREESWTLDIALDPLPGVGRFAVPRSVSCPFHERIHQLVEAPGDARATVWQLLESVGGNDPVLVLDWPVCASARCSDCGHQWAPRRRLALFRRAPQCPGCGGANVKEEETVRSLTRHSSWASASLEWLGLPPRHLYTVRTGDTQ